jgi:hypothetical protein
MSEHFGPLTWVRFNQLPDGPCIGVTYQDLERALVFNAFQGKQLKQTVSGIPKHTQGSNIPAKKG